MPERYAGADIDQAVSRALAAQPTLYRALSQPMWVTFPAANTQREVAHGLLTVPHGYHVLWADAAIKTMPGVAWTRTLAYLQSDTVNSRALLVFFVLAEDPLHA